MEHEAITPFVVAGGLGVILALGWIAANILGRIWSWCWAWIDDSEAPPVGPINKFMMGLMGFELKNSVFMYHHKDDEGRSDGHAGFFIPLLILFLAPVLMTLSFFLYPLTLSIFGLYLTARLARFARRHKKLFDEHVKDQKAHK